MTPTLIYTLNNVPINYSPWTHEYATHLNNSCQNFKMNSVPFPTWLDFYQKFSEQHNDLSKKFYSLREDLMTYFASHLEELEFTGLSDPALSEALERFEADLIHPKKDFMEGIISDECDQNMFIFAHNIRAMRNQPLLYQYASVSNSRNTNATIDQLSVQIKNRYRRSQHQRKKRQINQLQTSFDHWPTSDAIIKGQIDDISKRIEALQINRPDFQNTLARILKDLEEINCNGSAIIKDLEALEQELLSSGMPHLLHGSKEKVAQLIRQMKDLVKFLSLYQTVCPLIDQKMLHQLGDRDLNQTTLLLNGQSKQQKELKEGLIPSWILYGITAVVSAIFGWILPRIKRQRQEVEDFDQSVEDVDRVDDSSSISQEEETSFLSKRQLFEQKAQQEGATKQNQSHALPEHVHDPIEETHLPHRSAGWRTTRMIKK